MLCLWLAKRGEAGHMTLIDLLLQQAKLRPHSPAVIYGDARLTYAELAWRAAQCAISLMELGIRPGDRVAVSLGNCAEFVIADHGSMAAGAIVVPLNPHLRPAERVAMSVHFEPALELKADSELEESADGERALLRRLLEASAACDIQEAADGLERLAAELDGDATAAILVTSGSTGEPKGVMLSGKALASNALGMADEAGARPGQVHLATLPLFHSFGATVSMNMPLASGGCCVVAPQFIPEAVAALAQQTKPSIWAAVPAMFAAMVESRVQPSDLKSIRMCISGGAPLAQRVRKAFEEKFGLTIYEGYGLTEASPVVSASRYDEPVRPGRVGKPLRGVRVRIEPLPYHGDSPLSADPLGHQGAECGELLVAGDGVMQGYYRRPDLTHAVMQDGWLRTGDVACVDSEGRLSILGRACYVINVGGFKVYPDEVEAVLLDHPCVADAMAFGIPHPVRGEVVAALVQLKPGCDPVSSAEIVRHARHRLVSYKVPARVTVVASMPRSATGKLMRPRSHRDSGGTPVDKE